MYAFEVLICLANLVCNEETALMTKYEVTESPYCVQEITDLQNWYAQGSENPKSDKLTFKMSCRVIEDKRG